MHFVYIFSLFLLSTNCLADVLEGRVVRIVDGDTLVLRKNSCRLGCQAIFVVQSTQDRVSHNLTVARNAMPRFVW